MAEALAATVMLRRARRLVRAFAAYGSTEAQVIELAWLQLRLAGLERERLLRPYRQAWRWYRHPLARAYRLARRRRRALR